MSKMTDTVNEKTQRLIVQFRMDGKKADFQWGLTQGLPLADLIGYIGRVQADLLSGAWTMSSDELKAVVIAFDPEAWKFSHFVHEDVPRDAMVGMLEVVKTTLVMGKLGSRVASNRVEILGPDGKPFGR